MTPPIDDIFDTIPSYYDRMNDIMSLGCHHLWKDTMVQALKPLSASAVYVDLASGSGDIAARLLPQKKSTQQWLLIDPSYAMLTEARKRMPEDVSLLCGYAEALPLRDESVDCLTFSFGLRNTRHRGCALKEIHRVLKHHGQALVMEFHKPTGPFSGLFSAYCALLPYLGQCYAGDFASYDYLAQSILTQPPPSYFESLMRDTGFVVHTTCEWDGLIVRYDLRKASLP